MVGVANRTSRRATPVETATCTRCGTVWAHSLSRLRLGFELQAGFVFMWVSTGCVYHSLVVFFCVLCCSTLLDTLLDSACTIRCAFLDTCYRSVVSLLHKPKPMKQMARRRLHTHITDNDPCSPQPSRNAPGRNGHKPADTAARPQVTSAAPKIPTSQNNRLPTTTRAYAHTHALKHDATTPSGSSPRRRRQARHDSCILARTPRPSPGEFDRDADARPGHFDRVTGYGGVYM